MLLQIPNSHPNPQIFLESVRIQIRGFLAALSDGFETSVRYIYLLPINTKNLFCCLIKVTYLSSDCYPRTYKDCSVQSADKTKRHPKAKLQNAPTFTGKGSHSHVCLLLVIKIKTSIYQLCKQQSSDTNVLIGQYRLSADYLHLT